MLPSSPILPGRDAAGQAAAKDAGWQACRCRPDPVGDYPNRSPESLRLSTLGHFFRWHC